MNKRTLFSLFLILLITITAFNVYVQYTASNDQLQAEIKHLKQENQQVIKERNSLKQTLNEQDPSKIQKHHEAIVDQVSLFIKTAFVHKKETYQERKKIANSIMSKELVNTFFPTEMYERETKTSVDNVEVFIKTGNLPNNHATVLVRLTHTLYSLQGDQKQVSPVFLELSVQLQEDHWVVTDFKAVRKEKNG
ncbi:hypothetical protein [Halobacillus amylolyticus]|uniref:MerR family transcriptional regulator n=1 Tax=Halobacillus amylolyticus TaxID=2932259 RepID=A0ABY4H5Z3_9BACI|nr:hypothetical protein [Halobacillus amylolyticus]UOR10270.1 hypothetical protein MUO15_11120 [Halobacillus amylolyticus]